MSNTNPNDEIGPASPTPDKPPRYTTVQVDVTSTPEFQADVEDLFGQFMRVPEVKAMPQGAQLDAAVMGIARLVALRDYEDSSDDDDDGGEDEQPEPSAETPPPYVPPPIQPTAPAPNPGAPSIHGA